MSDEARKSHALSDLPLDELVAYGEDLGLTLDPKAGQGELLRHVRERQDLLKEIDREAMLDIVVWARRPVRRSISKEELAKEIASVARMDFGELSDRGLAALARLRGLEVSEREDRAALEQRIRDHEPFWNRVKRHRRRLMGSLISRMLEGAQGEASESYRFLPEEGGGASLKERISEKGVVGGLARTIRGVADDYVKNKLDEIELRIDRKLDEIDRRLEEWRDREIATRLKIIRITLLASVLVALLSYGYTLLRNNG